MPDKHCYDMDEEPPEWAIWLGSAVAIVAFCFVVAVLLGGFFE
jgi:hypothetical protein